MSGAYRFLPWTREGLAGQVTTPDPLDGTLPAHARFPVRVRINAGDPAGVDVQLYGPGDIVGVDQRGIIRTDPVRNATDVEANNLVAIEFDRPDFPWMFTPARADGRDRLRPWCVLVVVRRDEGVDVHLERGRPLPTVVAPGDQLPPLEESWAWAHGQVVTEEDSTAAIVGALRTQPNLTASRILCPRRLEPDARWIACLVPAFAAGVRAGLGMPPDDENLDSAWSGDEDEVVLPVYHHWEFATGPAGDFESLARRLTPPPVPLQVGTARMHVGRADPGLPHLDGEAAVVDFEGALVGPLHDFVDDLAGLDPAWTAALADQLDAPAAVVAGGSATGAGDPGGPGEPEPDRAATVAPPLYGQWPAHVHRVPDDVPAWLRELNLDPRFRAVAGLAAEVVRANQEALMHDAWLQVGDVLAANALLELARFSREVAGRLHRRLFTPMGADEVFRMTTPLHARVLVDERSVTARLHASALPDALASPAFRRVAAAASPVMRRAVRHDVASARRAARPPVSSLVARLDADELPTTPPEVALDALDGARALASLQVPTSGTVDLTAIGGRRSIAAGVLTSLRGTAGSIGPVPRPGRVVLRRDLATKGAVLGQTATVLAADGTLVVADAPGPGRGEAGTGPAGPVGGAVTGGVFTGGVLGRDVEGLARRDLPEADDPRPGAGPSRARPRPGDDLPRPRPRPGDGSTLPRPRPGDDVPRPRPDDDQPRPRPRPGDGSTLPPPRTPTETKAIVARLSAAFATHVATLVDEPTAPSAGPIGLAAVRDRVVGATDPRTVVPARVASMIRVDRGAGPSAADGDLVTVRPDLAGLVGSPSLRRPMYAPLAAHAPDRLLPGIGAIPTNTVALLKTNPRFVAAFLVGANHEFAGELVWRSYPARRDGTTLRHFWDRRDGGADLPDLLGSDPTLRLAELAGTIGAAAPAGGGGAADGDVVLIVRGDLLRRYPTASIHLVRSTSDGDPSPKHEDHREPVFSGRIDPDVHFIGFDLAVAEVVGDPGWFVIIQQQPTEPRFGFDVPVAGEDPPATWRDATWAHMGVAPGAHLRVDPTAVVLPADQGGTTFVRNAAHLAAVTLQQPVRVAIHARDLLGGEVPRV